MISNLLDIRGYFFIPDSFGAAYLSFMISLFALWFHKLGAPKGGVKLVAWVQLVGSLHFISEAHGGSNYIAAGSVSSYKYNHLVLMVVVAIVLIGPDPKKKIREVVGELNSELNTNKDEERDPRWTSRNMLKKMLASFPIAIAISIVYTLICRLVYSF